MTALQTEKRAINTFLYIDVMPYIRSVRMLLREWEGITITLPYLMKIIYIL